MLRAGSLLTVLVLWLSVSPAAASDLIVPVSQDRWITVYAFASDFTSSDSDSDSLAASDFGLFQADTTVTAVVTFASASSSASQSSRIQADSLQANGDIQGEGDSLDYEAYGIADSESHFEVTFDLTDPAIFTLAGSLSASGPQCSTTVVLDGPGGTVAAITAKNDTVPVLETGTLSAATYTLVANSVGRAYGDAFILFGASGDYDLLFTVTPATGVLEGSLGSADLPLASPNPFREQTTISFGSPTSRVVEAGVYDLRGRLVRRLTSSETDRSLSWDGRNDLGDLVRAGVYFVRLEDGREVRSLKVTRLR